MGKARRCPSTAPRASPRSPALRQARQALPQARAPHRPRRARACVHHRARPSPTQGLDPRHRAAARPARALRRRRASRRVRDRPRPRRDRRRVHPPLPHQHPRRRPRRRALEAHHGHQRPRHRCAAQAPSPRQCAPRLARPRLPRRVRAMEVPRLPGPARRRGSRSSQADPYRARDQPLRLPFLKTVDDFDFTYQSTVKLSLLSSALSPDFVTDGRSLILHGKPGRGKTHIAVAIGYRAIQNGFDTLSATSTRRSITAPRAELDDQRCSVSMETPVFRTSSLQLSPRLRCFATQVVTCVRSSRGMRRPRPRGMESSRRRSSRSSGSVMGTGQLTTSSGQGQDVAPRGLTAEICIYLAILQ